MQPGPHVGVHVGGDVQPGVAEQVFDRHEFDALFQQQRRTRMSQIVKPDVADFGQVADGLVLPVHVGRVERPAGRRAEHHVLVGPPVTGFPPVEVLPLPIPLQSGDTGGREQNLAAGRLSLGRLKGSPALDPREGSPHGQVPAVQVDVRPLQAEQFTPAQPGA